MPLATWQTAEGEEFEYYVPRGASVEAQAALGKRAYYARRRGVDVTQPPPVESTMLGELGRGTEQAISSLLTAGQSIFGDPEEAAREALARQEDIAARYGDQGPSLSRIQDVYGQEGLLAAIGETIAQTPRAIMQQVPQLAGTGIAAGLGTLLGGPAGGVAGASAFIAPQMAGSNIMAQAAAQEARGEGLDIDVGKAFGTAALQTAPELLGQYLIIGRGITNKLLGIDPQKLLTAAQRKAAADKLLAEAQRGFRRTAGAGAARGAAGEASTEVFQQILERAQAGEDLLSPEALASYGEAAFLGGTVGGALGPIGALSDRSAARRRVEELKAAGLEEPPRPGTALVPLEPPPGPPSGLPSLAPLTGEVVPPSMDAGPLALSAPEPLRLPAPSRTINVGPEGTAFPASLQDLYDQAKADEAKAEREAIGLTAAGAGTPESVIRRYQETQERLAAESLPPQREMFDEDEAPIPSAKSPIVTASTLRGLGIAPRAGVIIGTKNTPSIVGKDINDPTDRATVVQALITHMRRTTDRKSQRKIAAYINQLEDMGLESPVEAAAQQPQQLTFEDQIAATQEREDLAAAAAQRRQEQATREAEIQQAYQQREDEQIGQAVAERIAQRPEGVPTAVGAAMQAAEARGRRVPGQAQLEIPTIPAADPTIQALAAEERAIEQEQAAPAGEAETAPVQGELIGPRGGPRTRMRPAPQAETEAQAEPEVEAETQAEAEAEPGAQAEPEAQAESAKAKARRERAQARAQENRRKAQEAAERIFRNKPPASARKDQELFDIADKLVNSTEAGRQSAEDQISSLSDDDYDSVAYYANYMRSEQGMDLPARSLARTAGVVDKEVFDLLKKNKLADALAQMSKMRDKPISRVASALAKVAGNTKVRFEAGLKNDRGETIAGKFEPSTNTVVFNADFVPTNHVVLHEVMHAATAAELANPSSPYTQQLRKLFDDVKDRLDTAYGATNLEEFIAEAFSNPEFQAKLAQMDTKGDKISVWSRFKNIINNIVRKLRGLPGKEVKSVRDEMDKLVMEMLAPAPESRGVADLYSAADTTVNMAKDTMNLVGRFAKGEVTRDDVSKFNDYMPGLESGVRNSILSALPLNSIAEYVKPRFPELSEEINALFRLIQRKNGDRQRNLLKVRDTYVQLDKIFRDIKDPKVRKEQRDLFNQAVMETTLARIDPTKPRTYYSEYRFTYINEDGTEVRPNETYKTSDKRNEAMAALIKEKGWSKDQADKRVRVHNPSEAVLEQYDRIEKNIWGKMDEKTAQKAYTLLRDAYSEAFVSLRKTLLKRIETVDADADIKQTYKDKILYELLNKESIEPYFPLYRKGDYWLTYTGKDPLTGQPAVYKEAFPTPEERERALRDLEQDPDVEKSSIAKAMRPEAAKRAGADKVDTQFAYNLLGTVRARTAQLVESAAKKAEEAGKDVGKAREAAAKGAAEVDGLVLNALLDAMPERSLYRAFKRRQNFRGAQMDALTVFKERMPAFLGQTSALEYDAPLNKAKANLTKLARSKIGTPDEQYARDVADHVKTYADFARSPVLASWARMLKSAGFGMTLGLNLSSALVNLFILPTVVFPYLAGKHGWNETFKAMNKARKLYMNTGLRRPLTTFEGVEGGTTADGPSFANVDFSDPSKVPEGFKKYGDEEARRNKVFVDVLNKQGLAQTSTVSDMLDFDNPVNSTWDKVNVAMGYFFHQGERFARQLTMKAAYDLILDKKAKGGKQLTEADYYEAAQEAALETEHTNSGALLETAPKYAQNNLGSILLMYKRFGISMLYLQLKMMRDALKGKESDVRKQAINQLIGINAMSGIFAGVQGMPIYGAVRAIANMFMDDEEDEDFDSQAASFFKEGMYSGIVNATGLDISPRIGLTNLLYRSQPNVEQESAVLGMMETLGGPVVGIGMRILDDAIPLYAEGEVWRGTEKVLPAAFANVMKAARYASEGGATTMRGDVIFDDFNPLTLGGQVFGFAPAGYTKQLEINSRDKRIDRVLNEKRTKLLRKRYMAIREGDIDGLQEVEEEINEFNARNPEIDISPETKRNSLRQHRVTDEVTRMFKGVTISPRRQEEVLRRRLEDLDESEFFQ